MIIEESNVLDLLEQGILAQVRSTYHEQKVKEIEEQLLHSMLNRYNLQDVDISEEECPSNGSNEEL